MSQSPDETPDRIHKEKPAKEQEPDTEGRETENEADKAIREAREKAETKKAPGSLSAAQVAAAVVSTGLLRG